MFDGATKLANMVAFPVLAFVMSEWGWRAGFLFTSVISVLFTAVWWWGYRDLSTARSLRPAEREFILEGGARDIDRGGARQFRSALRSGRIWLLSCGFACYGYTINIVLTWMPEFLQREFHVRLLQSGIYSMIPWAVATVAELIVGGWLVDRLVRRGRNPWTVRKTVLTCGLALGATIGAAGSADSPAVAVVWMSLSLAGLAIAAPVAWGLPGLLAPPGTVGAVSGLMNFLNTAATAGGSCSPVGWPSRPDRSTHRSSSRSPSWRSGSRSTGGRCARPRCRTPARCGNCTGSEPPVRLLVHGQRTCVTWAVAVSVITDLPCWAGESLVWLGSSRQGGMESSDAHRRPDPAQV